MHPLACVLAALIVTTSVFAQAPAECVAIYSGIERLSSTGGGDSPSLPGTATGKRRQTVYLAVDTNTGVVQRVRLLPHRKYLVEDPLAHNQVFVETGGGRSKDYVRLMIADHKEPAPGTEGETTNSVSQYDGKVLDSVMDSAGLTKPYARVLTWSFAHQYVGFTVQATGTIHYPQIDSGKALVSLNRILTQNASGLTLSDSITLIKGYLARRHYTEDI